ncbi:MAG: hypothetical protein OXQ29_19730 [Rhodospirillaceae bacterium]|nr:hypothetical protein [Rhodospirillaceae bacterium]
MVALLFTVTLPAPAAAQIPADVSMGFTFGGGAPVVTGEVTEHLNDRLAIVGGAYWGAGQPAAVGFHMGPRFYTEPAGRLRPFGELAAGFSSTPNVHGFIFTPTLGVEVGIGRRTRFRTSAGVGLGLGGRGDGTGFTVTTALVLLPARAR